MTVLPHDRNNIFYDHLLLLFYVFDLVDTLIFDLLLIGESLLLLCFFVSLPAAGLVGFSLSVFLNAQLFLFLVGSLAFSFNCLALFLFLKLGARLGVLPLVGFEATVLILGRELLKVRLNLMEVEVMLQADVHDLVVLQSFRIKFCK